MKKIFLFAVIASLLFAVSCDKKEMKPEAKEEVGLKDIEKSKEMTSRQNDESYAFSDEIIVFNDNGSNVATLVISSNKKENLNNFIADQKITVLPIYKIETDINDIMFNASNLPVGQEVNKEIEDISIAFKEVTLPSNAIGYSVSIKNISSKSKGVLGYFMNSPRGYSMTRVWLYSGHINFLKFWAAKRYWHSWTWLGSRSNWDGTENVGLGMVGSRYQRININYIDGADWMVEFINF